MYADAAADPAQIPFAAAGGADMPTIDADDMNVVGTDGMLDSMEAPLKFEEDDTCDDAPSQEDPFMSFFPTGTHLPAH